MPRSRSTADGLSPGLRKLWTSQRSRPSMANTSPRPRGLMQSIAQAGAGIMPSSVGVRI
jgi:hypothetical protein